MDTVQERLEDPQGDPVLALSEALACAILTRKDGWTAEAEQVAQEAREYMEHTLRTMRSHGLATYIGEDLALTTQGLKQAAAFMPDIPNLGR